MCVFVRRFTGSVGMAVGVPGPSPTATDCFLVFYRSSLAERAYRLIPPVRGTELPSALGGF